MNDKRKLFETRRAQYLENATKDLARLNANATLFCKQRTPFVIGSMASLRKKSAEGWVTDTLRRMLAKAVESVGSMDGYACRKADKCRAIDALLSEPARQIREALEKYGDILTYDNVQKSFVYDAGGLERHALTYADDF